MGCVRRLGSGADRGEGGGTNTPTNTPTNPHITHSSMDPYAPFQYESKASRGLPHLNLTHFLRSIMSGTPLADFITEERPVDDT